MPTLTLTGITRTFGSRTALEGVDLTLEPGAVHCLVGENGAGKSTLLKVACGLLAPDAGTVALDGDRLPPGEPQAALRRGVGVVHQHFMLVEPLTVLDNVLLGAEPRTGPGELLVDRKRGREALLELAKTHRLPVDPERPVEALAVGERQRVELLKVLYRGARVLLFDEPTAVLSPGEVGPLLQTLRSLADDGAAVLFVTHKLEEVFAVADTVTVLRRGRVTLQRPRADTTRDEVVRALVGGEGPEALRATARAAPEGAPALELRAVTAPGLRAVTLAVRPGEVLGVAGVEGNGQRPLAEVCAGVLAPTEGEVRLGGRVVNGDSVAARRQAGFGWVPEDREGRGLLGDLTVAENVALGDPLVATRGGRYDRDAADRQARALLSRFRVRPEDPEARVRDLSGGNQQKVLLGRELLRPLKALVVAQPTRGVDLAASAELHAALRGARDAGVAVLLISSELAELRALSDRVVVLRRGEVVGEAPAAEATDARLGAWMVGG
ncbi:MAG: ABC transporter ATP-binding protein [Deltaproteobacteria bacterium]|nr:ABC transporter ATP-binding protein [Deltaproteobacteria bacterium]